MSRSLTAAEVDRYHRDGFVFPIPVLSPGEAAEHRRRFEAVEPGPMARCSGASRTCC